MPMTFSNMRTALLGVCAATALAAAARGQTNVRGWYVDGQVFIVWEVDPLVEPVTYDIYASVALRTDVSQMTLIGRLFPQEWAGQRLRNLQPGVTLRVPAPIAGSSYQLTATEGAFVFTPHQAGTLYF